MASNVISVQKQTHQEINAKGRKKKNFQALCFKPHAVGNGVMTIWNKDMWNFMMTFKDQSGYGVIQWDEVLLYNAISH